MTIKNIHRGKGARSHILYGELYNDDGELEIAATLVYILQRLDCIIPACKGNSQ